MMGSSEFSVISLFSGLGGMDIGLEEAGYVTRLCLELENDCVETLKLNRPHWPVIHDDLKKVDVSRILSESGLDVGESFMVAGGPPCQSFSKSAYWVKNRIGNISSDPRSHMLHEFYRVVKEVKPKTFLLENVSGLSYKTSRTILNRFLQNVTNLGYSHRFTILNAANFGVPQKRKRIFILGVRNCSAITFPEKTHVKKPDKNNEEKDAWVTAGDAIGHLDDGVVHDGKEIGGMYGNLLPEIPPGENYLFYTMKKGYPNPKFEWRSRFWTFLLKLHPGLPSWTIQANPAKYQGPFHWNNRSLSVNELKALQTIPDNWKICGNPSEVKKQIGNACPPKLIEALGKHIVDNY